MSRPTSAFAAPPAPHAAAACPESPSRRSWLGWLAAAAAPWPSPGIAATATGAPAVALPGLYDERIDPSGWLVSEKYDGVRGIWDGRNLRFRSGRPVPAPAWFTARLPRCAIDGELWLDRGCFDALSGLVRSDPPDDAAWQRVRFMAFDLPAASGRFDARAEALTALVRDTAWPQLLAAPQSRVADRAALQRLLRDTVSGGGEGLVLHLASAPWAAGRSDVLLKLKPALDTEATVVAYRPGRGKYAGQVGALEVRTPEGRRFFIGSGLSDELRRAPPAPGSVVTYRYRDLTPGGVPRFASFLRVHDAL